MEEEVCGRHVRYGRAQLETGTSGRVQGGHDPEPCEGKGKDRGANRHSRQEVQR